MKWAYRVAVESNESCVRSVACVGPVAPVVSLASVVSVVCAVGGGRGVCVLAKDSDEACVRVEPEIVYDAFDGVARGTEPSAGFANAEFDEVSVWAHAIPTCEDAGEMLA